MTPLEQTIIDSASYDLDQLKQCDTDNGEDPTPLLISLMSMARIAYVKNSGLSPEASAQLSAIEQEAAQVFSEITQIPTPSLHSLHSVESNQTPCITH